MGELWRSEPMQLVQLFIPLDAAHDTVDELGELGLIQFRDLNEEVNLFQRNFVNDVKRSDEMMRKIRFFADQIRSEYGVKDTTIPLSSFIEETNGVEESSEKSTDMDELESHYEDLEKELSTMNSNQDKLMRNYNELIELRHVLMKDSEFFSQSDNGDGNVVVVEGRDDDTEAPLLRDEESGGRGTSAFPKAVRLGFLTGVIPRDRVPHFERILWRATRGNLFLKMSEISERIEDPNEPGKAVLKNVFIIFFQGARVQAKIKKICESFGANIYPCPDNPADRRELLDKVSKRLDDLDNVIQKSSEHRRKVLNEIGRKWDNWRLRVVKEKAIYHTMNMFNYDIGRRCLIAEGWCPINSTNQVQEALKSANKRSGSSVPSILNVVPSKDEPPTYFRTNKFTESFQNIVDAYGVARYQEVNPTPLSIITFPFLFGVMFGDVGHGFLMLLYAGFLIWKEKKFAGVKLNEMIQTTFDGRYVLVLMAIFAIYSGAIYNEIFGIPFDLFGSRWEKPGPGDGEQYEWTNPAIAYPFGVDPNWKYRKNELNFYNSLKMKLSIVFGVTQMSVGIILSLFNGIHFRKTYNILFEFIPQIMFLWSIFGYMCFLIFLKWCTVWESTSEGIHGAPSLLNSLIDMFLKILDEPNPELYPGQKYVQWVIIFIAVVSVPIMLLVKPLLLRRDHKRKVAEEQRMLEASGKSDHHHHHHKHGKNSDEEDGGSASKHGGGSDEEEHHNHGATTKAGGHGGGHGHDDEEFDFSEIFVHQIIHTIEFVLGCVSNTASYLRLWALSLAHSELAYVFWSDILVPCLTKNVAYIFVGWAVWAAITAGVLLVMESLSAFLHALRLHWVEFMNKFYAGDGYAFVPFNYTTILKAEEENDQNSKSAK